MVNIYEDIAIYVYLNCPSPVKLFRLFSWDVGDLSLAHLVEYFFH